MGGRSDQRGEEDISPMSSYFLREASGVIGRKQKEDLGSEMGTGNRQVVPITMRNH